LETQSQASNELVAAQQQVADAKTLYRSEPTEANLAKIRAAELAASEALKKVQSVTKTVLGALTPNSTISAQDVEAGVATITAQISGEQATATTLNSGINALPGGFGAYVNEVSKQNANIVKTVRTLTSATTSNTGPAGAVTGVASSAANTAADGALTQAKNFVGNIVNKTTTAVSSFVDSTLGKLGKVPVVGGLLAGAAKSVAGGLLGKTFAGLGSLGNNGGQIRSATVAKDTFVAAPQQSVKIAQLLNNPLVPKPDFVETRFIPSNDIAGEQIADINRLSQINQLEAERDKLLAKYNEVQLQLATAAGTNIGNIQKSSNDLNALNKQLAQVNTKISAITDTWFG
jgi:hypothetical protein